MTTEQKRDVLILGGGLAGLTLALQLKQRIPDLDIQVLERRAHPVPFAAHKVGESSVEIAADYLGRVLGLEPYLRERQLKKFGFRFFFSDGAERIDAVTELGASRYLSTPSYQLDRGLFENDLGALVRERGIAFDDATAVRRIDVGDTTAPHRIEYADAAGDHVVEARWLVDASGRAGLLKRRLGLAEANSHDANAVWFRIGARIDIDTWSDDPAWLERCDPPNRWLSTNHLVGDGYWVWLIPLASGSHSVGIVADAKIHPLETIDTFEKAMGWLEQRQPCLFRDLDRKRGLLQDFAFFRRYSYGCTRMFDGPARWALTGEAGLFLDPFYSPGGDFIAISNTYVTELVERDRTGRPVALQAALYERIYLSFYRAMLPLYEGQYGLFGDPEVLPVKVLWDYTYYWGVLCQIFFQRRLTDLDALGRLRRPLAHAEQLNRAMQSFLRAWSRHSSRDNPARLLDQAALPWFAELNRGLRDNLDDAGFERRMTETLGQLDTLAAQIVASALARHPELSDAAGEVLQSESGVDACASPAPSMLFE